ncbi:MAG: glutamine--fructose-6-phosphate transaminase (isomerizing), partial [Lachnospiraceae bacterium]|nr:glutamine--fructose-6-phosphate transaminase (isomerizing) [Lachnospiraceae bacterium]
MCGIVGYTGNEAAAPILLDGLSKLEYRGYDSAGIAVFDPESRETTVVRAPGRLLNLVQKTDGGAAVPGNCGIGHTRWATHGEPTEANAHPHHSAGDLVIGAHNGIIENYQELKQKLLRHDYTFYSDTDTEVAVNLVDYYYKKYNIGPIDAIAKAMVRIRGTYALALMFRDYPGEIWVARKDSPLIIGLTDDAALLASDVPAILKYTRTVYYIDNLEMARLTPGHVTFYDLNGDAVEKESTEITWDAEAAEKGGYEHFMLKEIHEQPKAVRDTLGCYIHDHVIDLSATGLTEEFMRSLERLYIIGCGSAYHVGAAGKYIIEDLADIPVETDLASEFRYRNPRFAKNSLMIVISQTGETADTLAALRMAKERGVPVLAVVNVV